MFEIPTSVITAALFIICMAILFFIDDDPNEKIMDKIDELKKEIQKRDGQIL